MSDEAEILAKADRGSVIAAAGCGKTELIAKAARICTGRQLVLTHTNAGVETVRRRLRRLGVPSAHASVDTLDGWSLKYVASYPVLSGGVPLGGDGTTVWATLRLRMAALLDSRVVRKVIECSYEGVLVDEYQDCDTNQHALISKLAEIRPVRVLGDPLQAVFGWAEPLPSWSADVEPTFPRIVGLATPWRWMREGGNAALGEWLSRARIAIEESRALPPEDPEQAAVSFVRLQDPWVWQDAAREACFAAAAKGGTVVAICKWSSACHTLAKMTGGLFQCVEPIEAKSGAQMLARLETAPSSHRAETLIAFVLDVAIHMADHAAALRSALSGDGSVSLPLAGAFAQLASVRAAGPMSARMRSRNSSRSRTSACFGASCCGPFSTRSETSARDQ